MPASQIRVKKLFIAISPFLILAAVLPFILRAVLDPNRLSLFSLASQPAGLRVWTSPATAITRQGYPVPLKLYAAYDSDQPLPTGLAVSLTSSPDLVLSQSAFSTGAFSGQTLLGSLTATPNQPGTFTISIAPSATATPITTGSTSITAQP